MKKRISFLLAAIMVLAVMIPAIPVSAAAEGTAISTAAELKTFLETYSDKDTGKYYLANDIVMNDTTAEDWYENASVVVTPNNNQFSGTFDGNGKTVYGFCAKGYNSDGKWQCATGFFGRVWGTACIENLTLDGFYVCGSTPEGNPWANGACTKTGVLVGRAYDSGWSINNCVLKNGAVTATGSMDPTSWGNDLPSVGVFVGQWVANHVGGNTASISGCSVDETVEIGLSDYNVGGVGLVGMLYCSDGDGAKLNISLADVRFKDYLDVDVIGMTSSRYTCSVTVNNVQINPNHGGSQGESKGVECSNGEAVKETVEYYNRFLGVQRRGDGEIRFVGAVKDYATLDELGFEVTSNGVNVDVKVSKVYSSIVADNNQVEAPDGYAYYTFVITGVQDGASFEIKTYSKTGDTAKIGYSTYGYVYSAS